MHNRARIVAGTALALVMTACAGLPAHASAPRPAGDLRTLAQPARDVILTGAPLIMAQATGEEEQQAEEERRGSEAEQAPAEGTAPEEPVEQEAPQAPTPEPAPAERPVQEETPSAPPEAAEEPAESAPGNTPPDAPQEEESDRGTEPVPGQPAAPQDPAPTPPREDATPPPAQEAQPPANSGTEPVPEEPTPPQAPTPTPPPEEEAPPPPAQDAQPPADSGTEPLPGQPAPPPAGGTPPPPVQGGEPPADSGVEPVTDAPREAPVLDSAKEDLSAPGRDENPQPQPADATPPPSSDREAQQFEEPVEVQPLRAEEGRRIDRREERRERREGADVLREFGDRVVIQLGNQVIVQGDDRGRIERDASEVYYEELPRGRTRETVVRPNGVQVVTVYDRYGDVVRRSRIMPDGREHVLVYAGDRDRDERRQWRDPGRDLPPLRLAIPAEDYILDARRVRDDRAYYDFLGQPPVDRVRRPYSVDEVRYSARVRDSVRRIDLDTITFDFGSATISEEAVPRLAGVAEGMERLLERNPGEVFLIEGHTDAVGSDQANLALSDRRAEAVASAMTAVFGIPPENLVTQGYGERYLKINTQDQERENRRVAIRRITPLVAPIADAQQ